MPGTYSVEMFTSIDGVVTKIAGPETFEAKVLDNTTLPAADYAAMITFHKKINEFNRGVEGALNSARDLLAKTDVLIYAIKQTPEAPNSLMDNALRIKNETEEILQHLYQDKTIAERNEPTYPTVYDRLNELAWGTWETTSAPTQTQKVIYQVATEEFEPLLAQIQTLLELDLINLEADMERYGAPWTPGRVPGWNK
jgi:hypothetical protein